ncbi:hypothetical protein [Allosalinactinospora lopnorensis]|uniref:hypothetical protein n=1 Tax=Allosalinactinospora lopnorensis TaxID=1352348 RepID=UPI000623F687|nr:hypothetical protein [Allosalinactinospora lopnorensis]
MCARLSPLGYGHISLLGSYAFPNPMWKPGCAPGADEDGANTSTLLAYSGHTSVASVARYARVSTEALSAWQAQRDPAARRTH